MQFGRDIVFVNVSSELIMFVCRAQTQHCVVGTGMGNTYSLEARYACITVQRGGGCSNLNYALIPMKYISIHSRLCYNLSRTQTTKTTSISNTLNMKKYMDNSIKYSKLLKRTSKQYFVINSTNCSLPYASIGG